MYIISRLPETSSAGSYIIALCIQKGNGMIDDHIYKNMDYQWQE